MPNVELTTRELSILTNALQSQSALGSEETELLKKITDIYKKEIETLVPTG